MKNSFLNKYEIKKVMQNEKFDKRLLVQHKEKKLERSLKIIKFAKFDKTDDVNGYNERIMRQVFNDLQTMKQKVVQNSINKVIDFSLEKNALSAKEDIYLITEA